MMENLKKSHRQKAKSLRDQIEKNNKDYIKRELTKNTQIKNLNNKINSFERSKKK